MFPLQTLKIFLIIFFIVDIFICIFLYALWTKKRALCTIALVGCIILAASEILIERQYVSLLHTIHEACVKKHVL